MLQEHSCIFTCVSHVLTRIEVQPYTLHLKLLSLEVLRSFERIWRSLKEANLLNEAELRSSEQCSQSAYIPWGAMACANLQCGNCSWKIRKHLARLRVKLCFFPLHPKLISEALENLRLFFSLARLTRAPARGLSLFRCLSEVLPHLQLLVVWFGSQTVFFLNTFNSYIETSLQ